MRPRSPVYPMLSRSGVESPACIELEPQIGSHLGEHRSLGNVFSDSSSLDIRAQTNIFRVQMYAYHPDMTYVPYPISEPTHWG